MSLSAENSLLVALRAGDPGAMERVLSAYEPYLRIVVRRMLSGPLRSKLDSVDVLQSVWADVCGGLQQRAWQFETDQQLRAFLVTAVKHRFVDRWRQNRRALTHEQPLAEAGALAGRATPPSDSLEAHELWEELLDKCPRQHHAILHSKRRGESLDAIADQQGLHKSSVRRILYQLAQRVVTGLRGSELDSARTC